MSQSAPEFSTILPLLKRLWPDPAQQNVTAEEIAQAVAQIFTNSLSPVQTGTLLTCLHVTGWDRRADVLAQSSIAMRKAASPVDHAAIRAILKNKECGRGNYHGGLCDIVGTGGDSHNTFNVSTTASIVASSLLVMAKHGNRASTSNSGSADLLKSMGPQPAVLEAVTPASLPEIYAATNYAFLFAPVFHPGMRHVAPVRKELGWRTIFNLLGPLSNPLDAISCHGADGPTPEPSLLEARLIGVARQDLGYVFADALRHNGNRKALVVCGAEDMDEISPVGVTNCWMLAPKSSSSGPERVEIESFQLSPSDFGLAAAKNLSDVSPGGGPDANAAILKDLLDGKLPNEDPVLNFVLINTAALFVVSGICEADENARCPGTVIVERGPGGGRWKEGVRIARWAIGSGRAREMWEGFAAVTRRIGGR